MRTLLLVLIAIGIFLMGLFILLALIIAWAIWTGSILMRYVELSQFEASILTLIGSFGAYYAISNFITNIIDLPSFLEDEDDDE